MQIKSLNDLQNHWQCNYNCILLKIKLNHLHYVNTVINLHPCLFSLFFIDFIFQALLIKHLCSNSDESYLTPGSQHYTHLCKVNCQPFFIESKVGLRDQINSSQCIQGDVKEPTSTANNLAQIQVLNYFCSFLCQLYFNKACS